MNEAFDSPLRLYRTLSTHYGDCGWWPGEPYEIMVGAILVQNTAWGNVVKSLANFGGNLSPLYIERLPEAELVQAIRPSGSYTAKARCVKAVTAWFKTYGYSVEAVKNRPLQEVRQELLAIRGIGKETADAIMLYVFYFPVFVVDAYLKRLIGRLGMLNETEYRSIQDFFEQNLTGDADLFGRFHILILEHGKAHCRKSPRCPGCPLFLGCGYPAAARLTDA